MPAKICNLIRKEAPALIFSFEICDISKNILFTEHVWVTAVCGNDTTTIIIIKNYLVADHGKLVNCQLGNEVFDADVARITRSFGF